MGIGLVDIEGGLALGGYGHRDGLGVAIGIFQLDRGRGGGRTKVSQDQVLLEAGGGVALGEEPVRARCGGADDTGSTGRHPTGCGNGIAEVHRTFDHDGQARAHRHRHLQAHRWGNGAAMQGQDGHRLGGTSRLAVLPTGTGVERGRDGSALRGAGIEHDDVGVIGAT